MTDVKKPMDETYVWVFVGGPMDGLRREYPEPLDALLVKDDDPLIQLIVPFKDEQEQKVVAHEYRRTVFQMSPDNQINFYRWSPLTPEDALMYLLKNYVGAYNRKHLPKK